MNEFRCWLEGVGEDNTLPRRTWGNSCPIERASGSTPFPRYRYSDNYTWYDKFAWIVDNIVGDNTMTGTKDAWDTITAGQCIRILDLIEEGIQ